jgi:hypothetical protein
MSLFHYLVPIVAVVAVAAVYDRAPNGSMELCNHRYALCTSAPCIPDPNDPSKAICLCDVEEGPSMATVACDTITTTDANGITTVYSTFSLKQFAEGKKSMKCPNGTPWTWCLNKRCTVDPADPKRAICTCDIKRTGEWTTLGGNCQTDTCKTSYWSGATMPDANNGNAFLVKALGKKSPMTWCQDSAP